jgi:hypothetical protein
MPGGGVKGRPMDHTAGHVSRVKGLATIIDLTWQDESPPSTVLNSESCVRSERKIAVALELLRDPF